MRAVELAKTGERSVRQLENELGLSANLLRQWVQQYDKYGEQYAQIETLFTGYPVQRVCQLLDVPPGWVIRDVTEGFVDVPSGR